MRIQKYQIPANGIVKQDNTYVAKPIEQTFIKRTYQPRQAYLSQDNRTRLQREEGRKKADEAYNQQMKDKNTAEAMNHLLGFSNFADIVGLGLGASALAKYGVKQGVKSASNDYTERLIKLLGNKKELNSGTTKYTSLTSAYADYLENLGVEMSQFTNKDLMNLMTLRQSSILDNLPNQKSVTLTLTGNPKSKNYGITLYNKDNKELGNLSLTTNSDKGLDVIGIESTGLEKGVSYSLYDQAIKLSNGKGVKSGKILQSPEQTYAVWDKYKDKDIVSYTGEHTFNNGRDVIKTGERYKIFDGPVVKLNSPYKNEELPIKSSNIFHPDMIDTKTGKLNPPNWRSKDIFRVGIPTILGVSSVYDSNK